jgi:DNA-binding response OmpR family regulator
MTVSGGPVRLGIIDNDRALLRVLLKRLDGVGWPYRVLGSPVPPEHLVAMRLDALVIDHSVLGPQGWDYIEQLCVRIPQLGVLVCSGQSTLAQRVRALRFGIDDWVTKPCHPEELIARVEAVVRRRRNADDGPAESVLSGDIEILPRQFQATAAGVALDLTRREFELLDLLASAEGQVLRREEIYERVWGYAMVHGDRSVDVYVRKLRQKLERASPRRRYIHTHFGIGYRFAPEAESTRAAAPDPHTVDESVTA